MHSLFTVQTETTEAKEGDAPDAAATTGDEFVKDDDDDKTEATEESKADENQNVTSEKTDEEDKQSEKETVNSDDVVVESAEMKEEDAITSDIHKLKKKKVISIKWQEEVESNDEGVLSEGNSILITQFFTIDEIFSNRHTKNNYSSGL